MAASGSMYTWKMDKSLIRKLRTAKPGFEFFSPTFQMHDLCWRIEIWPNGRSDQSVGIFKCYVCLISMPKGTVEITIQRVQQVAGTDLRQSDQCTLNKRKMYANGWNQSCGRKVREHMMNNDHIDLNVELHVLAVMDQDGNDLTELQPGSQQKDGGFSEEQSVLMTAKLDSLLSQMQHFGDRMDAMEQRMDGIQMKLDEEQKEDPNLSRRVDQVVKDMNVLKKEVRKLSSLHRLSPEQQKLKAWMESTVKLPEYFDLFVEAGVDDLDTVAMMDKQALIDIGVDKLGHQIKILGAARKVQVQQTYALNEGNTAQTNHI